MVRALVWLLGRLSFAAAGRLGAAAGGLMYRLGGDVVVNARTNLAICFPQQGAVERERLVQRNLVESGRALAQMMRLFTGRPPDLDRLVDENGFIEACQALLAQGRGLVVALPHLGNWELIAYRVTRAGRATALYRPPRLAGLDAVIRAGRRRSGIEVVPIDRQGLKRLHAGLRDGEMVGILPDQVPKSTGSAGVVAPFFGRPAFTMTLVNRLVRRHGSPVIFCCAVPDPTSGRHRFFHFTGDAAIGDDDAVVAAAALNAGIERCAREFPQHYQWTYRRFQIPGSPVDPYADARRGRRSGSPPGDTG